MPTIGRCSTDSIFAHFLISVSLVLMYGLVIIGLNRLTPKCLGTDKRGIHRASMSCLDCSGLSGAGSMPEAWIRLCSLGCAQSEMDLASFRKAMAYHMNCKVSPSPCSQTSSSLSLSLLLSPRHSWLGGSDAYASWFPYFTSYLMACQAVL